MGKVSKQLVDIVGGGIKFLIKILIVLYQKCISPFFPPQCRFYPSCSEYAKIAIERHGVILGGFLTIKRLLKCHPFNCKSSHYDPVPKIKVK